jgi:hypothetical protein
MERNIPHRLHSSHKSFRDNGCHGEDARRDVLRILRLSVKIHLQVAIYAFEYEPRNVDAIFSYCLDDHIA